MAEGGLGWINDMLNLFKMNSSLTPKITIVAPERVAV